MVRRRFTVEVFPGPLYERCALAYCRRKKYRILGRNLHISGVEIDCLAEDRGGGLRLIEVRGKGSRRFRPAQTLSFAKVTRLQKAAEGLRRRFRQTVVIELLEVVGPLPTPVRWWHRLWLKWVPEKLGLELKAYRI
jgi:Holliday junction resolvase-like predicted endonuclease